jgi:hypothetical protein
MYNITKVEIPVGTRLVINNKTVECVKRDQIDCEGCIFRQLGYSCEISNMDEKLCIACASYTRQDKNQVIFKEVEE